MASNRTRRQTRGTTTSTQSARRRRFVPTLELMEERLAPAVDFQITSLTNNNVQTKTRAVNAARRRHRGLLVMAAVTSQGWCGRCDSCPR